MKKLNRSFDSRGRTLVYENLKGTLFSRFGAFRIGALRSAAMFIDLLFEDKTVF